ncbi:putative uncharacterized protein DDB_G0282499 [Prorops nasuta]|uniref:putative uncharacterized protein DDB_G0282499 n=1 Tax=Prorops nasuta TaxID=863751 RepID=UPI0034CD18A9
MAKRCKKFALIWWVDSEYKDVVELSVFPKNRRNVDAVSSITWKNYKTGENIKAAARIIAIGNNREELECIVINKNGQIQEGSVKAFSSKIIEEKKNSSDMTKLQKSVKMSNIRQINNEIKTLRPIFANEFNCIEDKSNGSSYTELSANKSFCSQYTAPTSYYTNDYRNNSDNQNNIYETYPQKNMNQYQSLIDRSLNAECNYNQNDVSQNLLNSKRVHDQINTSNGQLSTYVPHFNRKEFNNDYIYPYSNSDNVQSTSQTLYSVPSTRNTLQINDRNTGLTLRSNDGDTDLALRSNVPSNLQALRSKDGDTDLALRSNVPSNIQAVHSNDQDTGLILHSKDGDTDLALRSNVPSNLQAVRSNDQDTGLILRSKDGDTDLALRSNVPSNLQAVRSKDQNTDLNLHSYAPNTHHTLHSNDQSIIERYERNVSEDSQSSIDSYISEKENVDEVVRSMTKSLPQQVTKRDIAFQELLLSAMKYSYKLSRNKDCKSLSNIEVSQHYLQPANNMEEIFPQCGFYLPKNKIAYINIVSEKNNKYNWKTIVREVLLEVYGISLSNYTALGKCNG